MEIPYSTHARADTGVYNGKLGVWLMIASSAMLFGGLVSAFVFLRNGDPNWPDPSRYINVGVGAASTIPLVLSSVAAVFAAHWARRENPRAHWALVTMFMLGIVFLIAQGLIMLQVQRQGYLPSTNNFLGICFVLTSVHGIHVLIVTLVVAFHGSTMTNLTQSDPVRFANRVEVTATYWHFVTAVWLVLFPLMYLL
jgi:heme/copper-type cytochrome/quinol oxidase subunit 3